MRLLQIEILKLGRLANYILAGLMLLTAAAVTGGAIYFLKHNTGAVQSQFTGDLPGLQWVFEILLGVFLVVNIGKEFSENTLKRCLIDGYTRDEFFAGKISLMLATVLFIFIVQYASVLVVGMVNKPGSLSDVLTASSIIDSLINYLARGILIFFLSMLTRSIAASIVLYLVWPIAEGSLPFLLSSFVGKDNTWVTPLCNHLPLTSIKVVITATGVLSAEAIFTMLAYLLVMLLLPYWLFLKLDIK